MKKEKAPKATRRSAVEALGGLVDSGVGIFSPRAAARRVMDRELLKRSYNLYAAAKTTRLTGPWTSISPNVNEIIRASSPTVRARVRQLVRDFPYFGRAVNNIVDYSIGVDIDFQSRAYDADGKPNKDIISKIESAYHWWADEADISGKMHFSEIKRLTKRQDVEAGEFLIVKVVSKNPKRYLPYALQVYEADWLTDRHDTYLKRDDAVTETKQGIEYRKDTGEIVSYWFADPDNYRAEVNIKAEQVVHGFEMLRPMQLRGVSPLAPGVLVAHDLSDYMDAEIDAAKFAAKYLAFVKTPNPYDRQFPVATDTPQSDDTIKKIETMENAIIEYLRPGEEVEIAKHDRPGTTFPPFVKLILTMLSVTAGVPYELVSGDYSNMNFATMKMSRNDFQQQLRPIAARHIRQSCFPAFKGMMDMAVLTGKLDLPGYWRNPRPYWESVWTPPGMIAVDPLREAKGQVEAIDYGLKSPQEVARERGRDLGEIYEEIKEAREMAKELGLDFGKPSTAQANNPAAINKEEDDED